MFKRSSANYSLWPEQARPRRGSSVSLAVGGFAIGIVCAVAAVNVASDFIRPVAMEVEPVEQSEPVRAIPVYSASSARISPAAEAESASRDRVRSIAAKVTLPTIGRAVPVTSETTGSGGDATVKLPPVRLTSDTDTPAGKAVPDLKLIRNDTKLLATDTEIKPQETKVAVHEPQVAEPAKPETAVAPQEEAKPAVKAKRSARKARTQQRAARENRRYERPRHQQPSYAARYRAGPVYGANGAPVFGYGYFPY